MIDYYFVIIAVFPVCLLSISKIRLFLIIKKMPLFYMKKLIIVFY